MKNDHIGQYVSGLNIDIAVVFSGLVAEPCLYLRRGERVQFRIRQAVPKLKNFNPCRLFPG